MSTFMKELLEVEEKLQFTSFSNEDALKLGLIVIDLAKEVYQRGVSVNIERNRQVLFTYFMEGTSYENLSWMSRKKMIVERFNHSSMYVGEIYSARDTTANDASFLPPSEYQAVGGCYPIFIKNTGAVGSLSISGMTAEEDHELCVKALTKLQELKNESVISSK